MIKEAKEIKISNKSQYYYGTGSRKTAIARVRIFTGKGKVTINDKDIAKTDPIYLEPLVITGLINKFDISVKVRGGGVISQIEAIRHGVARAIVEFNKEYKPTLRKAGFMTRDPRKKERKKPGLKRARRAPQWQKR